MVSPTDEDLIKAVKAIRLQDPALARAKVLKQLKDENGWELSEKRLKTCMDTHKLGAVTPALDPEVLKPRDAAFDEMLKEAFQELTRFEREFYLGLSKADAKVLMPVPGINPKDMPFMIASSQRHYVEILLTLKGIKPCTVIFHPYATEIYTRLVNEVLKPVIKKYKLKTYGFELRQVDHATMIEMGRPEPDMFWRGGWIFADILSPLWRDIQGIFFTPTEIHIFSEECDIYQDKLCKVFGYPVRGFPRQEEGINRVQYMDETECGELAKVGGKSEDEVEVIGFEYEDDDGDEERWMKCLIHFESCQRAMKSVGSRLELDLRHHNGLFNYVHHTRR
ncbi:hypothetical protein ONS95_012667 [Cadophora gregata]|uniref:uncharacterized protein n=1 Tax=Cadophora gregata TaxID=51156 RepID=UPI0026DD0454|nr:uncharacterized protein ONS95_012667 [Cadophora gregata]KAK0118378.1 hypothetical protein ONS95_012667 [Cadophora gregata]KAK0123447.1 hypothetical protein ONS96_010431 [Cadophora gregata f. sp. sojae]